jgi:capsular exopolysaccharide synthesis family protein
VSKIFEILNKSEGEIATLVRPMVTAPADPAAPAAAQSAAPAAKQTVAAVVEGPRAAQVHKLRMHLAGAWPVLPFENGQWRPSEQYRILRTKIIQHPKQPRLMVVSSPASRDGKTITAINAAGALSLKTEARVLLIDADLRRSAIHTLLGLPASPGLSELLTDSCALEEALVQTEEFPNLYVIPAGSSPANPVELLDRSQWPALCDRLRAQFRYVLVDSPPVGAVADYDLIQAACDGVILVLRPDHTRRELYHKALETVPKSKLLGVVLNCVPDWPLGKIGGADYYYYSGARRHGEE